MEYHIESESETGSEADPSSEIGYSRLDLENVPEITPCARKALKMLKIVDCFPYNDSVEPYYESFECMVESFRRIVKKELALFKNAGKDKELHRRSMDTIGYHAHLVNERRRKLGLTKFIELTDIWDEYRKVA